ncbi:hypothetical protein [Streptomyces sp. NPDC058623]|uniref:hypothetical protein n=1 Tax=Streptomyces sp. NPDC058623 TaxID=3346563 RepID=UPI00364D0D89
MTRVAGIDCGTKFDQDTLRPLEDATAEAANDPALRRIVLDVSRVVFADSSMLNLMVMLRRSGRWCWPGLYPVYGAASRPAAGPLTYSMAPARGVPGPPAPRPAARRSPIEWVSAE